MKRGDTIKVVDSGEIGTIIEVDKLGNLVIEVDEQLWAYNPQEVDLYEPSPKDPWV